MTTGINSDFNTVRHRRTIDSGDVGLRLRSLFANANRVRLSSNSSREDVDVVASGSEMGTCIRAESDII
jgi:hypothetical protein